MRKFKIVVTLLIVISLAMGLMAREPEGFVPRPLAKTSLNQTNRTMSNISNWGYWMYASGKSAQQPNGNSGGIYPRGTAGTIYQDGLVWGGKFGGDASDLRVGGVTYATGTVAGWINDDGTAASPSNERVKIWRIRPDYATLTYDQVRQGAMELNELSKLGDVTDAMCQAVIDQYKEDWENWPVDLGAPYVDVNGDGEYNGDDYPGIANADQVVWYVTNDLDRTAALSLAGSEPMGIELQITAWAYAQPGARLGQIVFKKYKFINKSGQDITDMFVSQWCDPDLGYYGNDLIGCDTTLSLGFAYNGTPTDADYDAFGLAPASIGYDFFQGPMVDGVAGQDLNRNGIDDAEDYAVFNLEEVGPGKINLPMSSFGWFAAGSPISDPTLGEYEGTLQWYNLMKGYKPTDDIDNPSPWTLGNVDGNPETKFPMAGDPVAGTGYLDAQDSYFEPGDRRMCLTAGPFDFPNGETQEVVVAVLGGLGNDNLSSVADLKMTDQIAQKLYNEAFAGIPKAPKGPEVSVLPFEDAIMLDWGSNADAVKATEGPTIAGYTFQGYNVYQLPTASSSIDEATKIATYDIDDGVKTIMGKKFLAEYGSEVSVPVQKGLDNGVQRYFKIDQDYITGKPLYKGKTYYFAVTAYNYNPAPKLIEAKALESAMIGQSVVVQGPLPGDKANVELLSDFEVTHAAGTAAGSATGTVIDPFSTTGHDYSVNFYQQDYYLDADGRWKEFIDAAKKLAKPGDVTDCDVTGSAVYSETPGNVELMMKLTYGSSTGAWIDGIEFVLPDGVTPLSAVITDGAFGNYPDYGQAVLSTDGVIEGNKISWGDSLRSGIGAIEGDMYFTIVLNSSDIVLPMDIDYSVWDDAYADPVVDDIGTLTLTEIGYKYAKTNYWNIKDETVGEIVLKDQYVVSGHTVDHVADGRFVTGGGVSNPQTVDGIQLSLNVSYSAPTDFTYYTEDFSPYAGIQYDADKAYSYYNSGYHLPDSYGLPIMITSYGFQGWGSYGPTATAWDTYDYAADGAQHGTRDMNILQNDIQLRFTGEYDWDNAVTTAGGGLYVPVKEGTGSKAVVVGARNFDLANHPDVNNPGDGSPFFVQIPFEVWDIEKDQQISIVIYDRLNDPASADTMYAFNPYGRMYTWFLEQDYASTLTETPTDLSNSDNLTWNLVFWYTNWVKGGNVTFLYDNPIQFGVDRFTFSTVAPTLDDEELAKDAVKKINVFPNPFYANNDLSTTRFDSYVTFTHLPEKATIRIFNLSGIQVRVLEKSGPDQFLKWDLQNEAGLPVGSGMYIAYIDLPDLGKEKVLKLAIIQKEEILEYY